MSKMPRDPLLRQPHTVQSALGQPAVFFAIHPWLRWMKMTQIK